MPWLRPSQRVWDPKSARGSAPYLRAVTVNLDEMSGPSNTNIPGEPIYDAVLPRKGFSRV
jgi:hypothetical protein